LQVRADASWFTGNGQRTMTIKPFEIGVCSWSLQVKSVPELKGFMDRLGVDVVQLACGDPHHASWDEGDKMPEAARAAGFRMTGTMLGFPGEDYTTPATIQKSGGFGDPALRLERLRRLEWGLQRTLDLGLKNIMFHGGFIPEPGDPDRKPFLRTLDRAGDLAAMLGVTIALETGQETAKLLRKTLDELKHPAIKVNFDPANMILYDMGEPIKAVDILGDDIVSVHVKDANRTKVKGTWGEEVPLGKGQVNMAKWLKALKKAGFKGSLVIEREVGNQQQRFDDIAAGIAFLRECLS
jgi:sugar phosphate isomerase/epimerase